MKIVHLITRLIIGGAQENTVLTCRGLVERGHQVTLIAGPETGAEGSLWEQAHQSGATLVTANHLRRAVHPWHDWRAISELTRLLRNRAPDVVHTHSSKAGILGRIAARRARVPIIVHTIHGMSFNRTQNLFTRITYRSLERRVAPYTSKFVTVADAMIEQSVAAGIAARDRFVTIRSGMEMEHFSPNAAARERIRAGWGVNDDQVIVGTIARLFKNKGYEDILAAMPGVIRQAPQARFVWVGDGKNRKNYEETLRSIGLHDHVIFTGLVPPDKVGEMINGFDLVLHASRWEGLPRAVVQGLLMGKPAVSFDNDGAPEIVQPHITGLLAPLGDITGLALAVVRLCQDRSLRDRLGSEGRRRVQSMFHWREMVAQLVDLYENLMVAANF